MSEVNLSMVVEIDAKQLEELREKMNKLDAQLLEKLEKASKSMTNLMEKLGYTMRTFIDLVGKGFNAICSKLGELKDLFIGIRIDLAELHRAMDFSTLIQVGTALLATMLNIMVTLGAAALSAGAFGTSLGSAGLAAGSLGASIGLLSKAILVLITFLRSFSGLTLFLEITGGMQLVEKQAFRFHDILQSYINLIKSAVMTFYNVLKNLATGYFSAIYTLFTEGPKAAVKEFYMYGREAMKNYKEGLSSQWDQVKNSYKAQFLYLKDILSFRGKDDDYKTEVSLSFNNIINSIKEKFAGLKDLFKLPELDLSSFDNAITTTGDFTYATNELAQAKMELYSIMDKYGLASLAKLNDETKTLLSEYDLLQANTTMNVSLTEQFAEAVAVLIEQYRILGKDAPQALMDLYQKSQMHKTLLENIPYNLMPQSQYDLIELPIQDQLLANIPEQKVDYSLMPSPLGGSSEDKGFFGGMKDSFWSGVDDLKKQFGFGGDKGMLGNLFGGGGTGGGLFGMLGSFAGPQSGLVGTIQKFASMLPGIGTMISNIIGGIGDFIKDINTELFLFIKYNYSLQHRYAKESNVGIGFIPVRAAQWDAYKY